VSNFEIKLVIPLDMIERGIKAFKAWKDKRAMAKGKAKSKKGKC
jgi:hypothetical protein